MALPVILAKIALGQLVGKVLDRPDVPIENKSVPAAVRKVETAIDDAVKDKTIAVVDVKSSWASKIEWTQAAGAVMILASLFGLNLTPEQQAAVVTVIALAAQAATWIMRRWFTTSITKSSAKGT
jgi:hypothetical protein